MTKMPPNQQAAMPESLAITGGSSFKNASKMFKKTAAKPVFMGFYVSPAGNLKTQQSPKHVEITGFVAQEVGFEPTYPLLDK